MRLMLAPLLLIACSKDPKAQIDASVVPLDAKPIDAAVDAPPDAAPDAPNMNVVTACMHACDAIAACVMEPAEPDCYSECAEDLADCTAEQVATIDACTTQECGDLDEDSPLLSCILGVGCVNMAITGLRR